MSVTHTVFEYTECIEYQENNPLYHGWCTPGRGKGESVWRICKYTFSGNLLTDVQFAEGSTSFKFVWNDRASYTYS